MTRQRKAIHMVFDSLARPLSPSEILQHGKHHHPSLSLATVYRNLHDMLEEKEIVAVALPSQPPRYELAGKDCHHHFICRDCDSVFDIDPPPAAPAAKLAPRGFRVEKQEMILYGRCPECH